MFKDSLYPCNSYIMLVEMYFDEDALVLHVWMCIFAYFDTYALWRSSAPFRYLQHLYMLKLRNDFSAFLRVSLATIIRTYYDYDGNRIIPTTPRMVYHYSLSHPADYH